VIAQCNSFSALPVLRAAIGATKVTPAEVTTDKAPVFPGCAGGATLLWESASMK
jgi:hypothetical protein